MNIDIVFTNKASKLKVALMVDSKQHNIVDFVSNFAVNDDTNCKAPNEDWALTTPHSSSFVDVDGDCMPDIFMTRTDGTNNYAEIYIQR